MTTNFTSSPNQAFTPSLPQFKLPHLSAKILIPLLVIILALFLYFRPFATNSTITLAGQGEAVVSADWATFVISRVDVANTVEATVTNNQRVVDGLINYLKTLGAEDQHISKGIFSLTPQTDGKYLVVNTITVRYYQLDKFDTLIKGLYINGATAISDTNFGLNDYSELDNQARLQALEDVQAKASKASKTYKKRLVGILSITDSVDNTYTSVLNSQGQSQIKLVKNIVVNYELK